MPPIALEGAPKPPMPPMAAGGAPMPPMAPKPPKPPMAPRPMPPMAPRPQPPIEEQVLFPFQQLSSLLHAHLSELAGASVDAAPVRRPASFFFAFELPEPSVAFFFADVFPFFGSDALGSFDGAAAARDGAGATPPVGVVIRGGKKRLRARPTVGGAPAAAAPAPKLAALGFSAAAAGGSRLYSGVPVCASMVAGALAPARAGAKEEEKGEFARALESATRGSGRQKYTARDEAMASAPNSF
ncbi:hypothetical protein D1007_39689 [Hordeum vulgare]|nr:hypothetical protein D1007_39689 [Hordeum vulgare]